MAYVRPPALCGHCGCVYTSDSSSPAPPPAQPPFVGLSSLTDVKLGCFPLRKAEQPAPETDPGQSFCLEQCWPCAGPFSKARAPRIPVPACALADVTARPPLHACGCVVGANPRGLAQAPGGSTAAVASRPVAFYRRPEPGPHARLSLGAPARSCAGLACSPCTSGGGDLGPCSFSVQCRQRCGVRCLKPRTLL